MQALSRNRIEEAYSASEPCETVARLLTEGRSCVVEVVNETSHTLRRVGVTALHGEFVTQPAALVLPGSSDVFGTQNRPRGVGVGCEAAVTYELAERLMLTLYFDNPFAGRNFAGAQFSGPRMVEYSCDARAESGDAHVPVRFVIRRASR